MQYNVAITNIIYEISDDLSMTVSLYIVQLHC
jgi:hypothetical protein